MLRGTGGCSASSVLAGLVGLEAVLLLPAQRPAGAAECGSLLASVKGRRQRQGPRKPHGVFKPWREWAGSSPLLKDGSSPLTLVSLRPLINERQLIMSQPVQWESFSPFIQRERRWSRLPPDGRRNNYQLTEPSWTDGSY